jgi:tetratricopeptide (TPR) repeat protein
MTLQPGSCPVPNYPDYVLVRKLGAGAFGEVWHAHGPGGIDVALKFIRLDKHVFAAELRSLEVMKSIRHPNLVSLVGAWHKDGYLILAMELCDRSLRDRLTEALAQDLPGIPLDELLGYMTDAANGLDALNAKQVQHRDVKPANLLLLNSGVKVADFGLAKALEQTVASNSGAGTIAYLAPECFKGQLTQQSDQYSLAVTYYHLRTGRLLFKGDQAQMMYAHLEVEPDLSDLPRAEALVLAQALSKEPGKRWQSCKALVNKLIAVANARKSAIIFYKRGKVWLDKEDYDKAIEEFEQAIQLDPGNALAYVGRGEACLGKEAYDKAITAFDNAIRFDPNNAAYYCNRGLAWLGKEACDKAITDFDNAIRLDPNNAAYYCDRGLAWSWNKNYDMAINDYDEAIRLCPKAASYYIERGTARLDKNEYDHAIKDFDEAVRLNPNDAYAYMNRGVAWSRKKDEDKAIKDYDEAIRLDPQDARFYHTRGTAWSNKKDKDKAIQDYNEAIRLNPTNASYYYNRAWALLDKCEFDKAIKDYDEAVRLDPAKSDGSFMKGYQARLKIYDISLRYYRGMSKPVADLKLSARTTNCLDSRGISIVRDLVALTHEQLLEIRDFGPTCLNEVREKLNQMGLKLRGD